MNDRSERRRQLRRHRLATGIFHQPVEGPTCQANAASHGPDPEVCGKPATEAVVEHGDYVPVCSHHAMIARRNHWAVGHLKK